MKKIATKFLLCISALTAGLTALLFDGDSIKLDTAIVMTVVSYIVFFVSLAILYLKERRESFESSL